MNPFFKFYPGSVFFRGHIIPSIFFVEYYVETKPFCVTFPRYLLNILLAFVVHRTSALFAITVFSVYFLGGLEWGYSFAYVAHFIFERCLVRLRFRSAAVASRRSTNLVTHLPELATHLPDLANHLLGIKVSHYDKNVGHKGIFVHQRTAQVGNEWGVPVGGKIVEKER